jgi:flagellin
MVIQHNMSASNANRNLGISTGSLAKSTEKLSSGYRINRAGDDAAGLAISEKMRGQIRGLDQASSNSEDSISLVQTAEGALQETQSIVQRMRELAVQASNDTNTDDDRTQIQNEITQLTQEVDRIANTSEFNTKKLLNGDLAGATKYVNGNASAEGTFTNGVVSINALTAGAASKCIVDDVLRITIQEDGKVSSATFSSLNGTTSGTETKAVGKVSVGKVVLSMGATDAVLKISKALISDGTNQTTAIGSLAAQGDLSVTIKNATNLKAGDVITISLTSRTQSKASTTGKESLTLQVGANTGQEINLGISDMRASALGIVQKSANDLSGGTAEHAQGAALDVTTQANASMAVESYDKALQKVSTERAKMGAMQNRLEHTITNLDTSSENLQAAESRIRDVDMADEMTQYSKNNILMQAGQSMLAQANQSTQGALSLLQ